ncbi:helicase C-terminal domain-containing protein [Microbacterium sp. NPDC076768]|uniref:helicase C-terminal domain-containing protein n=1 Tax=Microbacterium sp. NPDC076768 TaxID=3154858 RepID=UPI00341D1432
MAIDFLRVGGSRRPVLIDPRDIFRALPTKPWPRLRLEQGEVLKGWFGRKDARDVVIKQNTGGGKTVVGLLIAQSSINDGVGPAIYLTPDTYLAAQAKKEAERLGIAVTGDRYDERFVSSEAILVTTFQKLVNGRSSFGVIGTGRSITSIGTVIVDDAHAALALAERQFTVTVARSHPAYNSLVSLFQDSFEQQSPSGWTAIDGGVPSTPVAVPFWDWSSRVERVRAILQPFASDDDEKWIYFAWPALSQVLSLCSATVTAEQFEIKPLCTPIDLIPAFAQAKRRIYLTATLADDSVLVTELGAGAADVAAPVTPERAADLGDRLILAPLALNPSADEGVVREMVKEISDGDWASDGTTESEPINVIVLVPSDARAAAWQPFANHTCHVDDLHEVVAKLKSGEHLGLVVLVNKYDGVDLPGDACRLLVIDGVPFPLSPSESREASALRGTDTFAARQVQKIEQGMGRGIRDAEDYCAVLVLGADLAMTLRAPAYLRHYSPATRRQIDLSADIAAQIKNQGLESIREVVALFLSRDPGWLAASSEAIAGIEYDHAGQVSDIAAARRRGFDLARANQMAEASSEIKHALTSIASPYEAGWYEEEAARYQHFVDRDGAQGTLRHASIANLNVMTPLAVPPVTRSRPAAEQARAASDFLAAHYSTGVELELGIQAMLGGMVFDPARVPEAEEAFERLGRHLGFPSERPDKIYKTGPDALWSVREDLQLVIELKTGVARQDLRIIKTELDQLSGHVNWHAENYGSGYDNVPVLVHPSSVHRADGTPAPGTRILTPEGIEQLKDRVRAFSREVAMNGGWKNEDRVRALLASHQLLGRNALLRSSVRPTREE